MRFVAFAAFLAACSEAPSIDPKVEAAVVSVEKFALETQVGGECVALKASVEALHTEDLKAVEAGSELAARLDQAEAKIKALVDGCAAAPAPAPEAVPAAPAVEAAPEALPAVPAAEAAPAH
jgi:hypothetical protein